MINIVGRRKWFFLLSAVVLLIGILSLAVFGLEPGVDFSSGTTFTIRFEKDIDQAALRQALTDIGYDTATIQSTSEGDYFIRISEITPEERQDITSALESSLDPGLTVRDYYQVSPVIATETARNAGIAVAVAAVAMLI